MSSVEPPYKRRRINPNAFISKKNGDDQKGGYDVSIFVDQHMVSDHICTICQCVFNEPMCIGCDMGHVFCKHCLNEFFKDVQSKLCPLDQQSVHKKNVSPNKYVERFINSFQVVCPRQYQQTSNDSSSNDDAKLDCEWKGSLSDMRAHAREQCCLFVMQCPFCGGCQQRKHMDEHVELCDERPIPCPMHCTQSIKRRLLASHIDGECCMRSVHCDDCKQCVLQKNIKQHKESDCQERLCKCPYATYGCSQMATAKELQMHVAENAVKHLQLTVEHLKNENQCLKSEVDSLKKKLGSANVCDRCGKSNKRGSPKEACFVCGKTGNVMRCSQCKQAFYCSREHQMSDWSKHKETCKIIL